MLRKKDFDEITAELSKGSEQFAKKVKVMNEIYDNLDANESSLFVDVINQILSMAGIKVKGVGDIKNKIDKYTKDFNLAFGSIAEVNPFITGMIEIAKAEAERKKDIVETGKSTAYTEFSGYDSDVDYDNYNGEMNTPFANLGDDAFNDNGDNIELTSTVQENNNGTASLFISKTGEALLVDKYGSKKKFSYEKGDAPATKKVYTEEELKTEADKEKRHYDKLTNDIIKLAKKMSASCGKSRLDETLFKSYFKKETDYDYKSDKEYDSGTANEYFKEIKNRLISEKVLSDSNEPSALEQLFPELMDNIARLKQDTLAKTMSILPQIDRLYQPYFKRGKVNMKIPYREIIEAQIIKVKREMRDIFYQYNQLGSGLLANSIDIQAIIKDKDNSNHKTITLILTNSLRTNKKYARSFEYGVSPSRLQDYNEKRFINAKRMNNGLSRNGFTWGIYKWIEYKIKNGSWEGDQPANDKERLRLAYAIKKSLLSAGLHTSKPTAYNGNTTKNYIQKKKYIESGESLYMFQYILALLMVRINREIQNLSMMESKSFKRKSDYYF